MWVKLQDHDKQVLVVKDGQVIICGSMRYDALKQVCMQEMDNDTRHVQKLS